MDAGRSHFRSDLLFLLVLAASVSGHVSLRWLNLATAAESQHDAKEAAATEVTVQLIAEPPPLPPELLEPPEPLPIERPEPIQTSTPDVSSAGIPRSRESVLPETVQAEPVATDKSSPVASPRPQPRIPPRPPRERIAPSIPSVAEEHFRVSRRRYQEVVPHSRRPIEVPETLVSQYPAGSEVPPSFISRPLPTYPRQLLRQRIEGVVRLRVAVGRDGRVGSVKVETSSGHRAMDDSALRTVKSWVFAPAHRGGIPVEKTVIVPIRFRIRTEE
jgi:protein TonB